MNKSIILLAVFFALLKGAATAQITVAQSDIQNLLGQSYDISVFQDTSGSDLTTDITTLASLKGANQTFDFTTITSFFQNNPTLTKISFLKLPANIPGASDPVFANANTATVYSWSSTVGTPDSTSWQYYQLKSDGFYRAGFTSITNSYVNQYGQSPDTSIISYNPYQIVYKLPLTYQTSWEDTTIVTDTIGIYTSNYTMQTKAVVDGYGILKLPNATANCLRISGTTTTITGTGSTQSKTTLGFIEYIPKSSGNMSAYIGLDQNGNPIVASYVEPATSTTPIEKNTSPAITGDYQLNQNYPNPFNPSTVISYDLKTAGHVKLDIYNALGQHVATLVNSMESAGAHNITFNASQLNSGLYFYKLRSGDFSKTRKMMLIK